MHHMYSGGGQYTCDCPQDKEIKKNNNAIFFSISDSYTFAVANVIMGLYQYSSNMMKTCDVVVYHNGLTQKNQMLLKQLHNEIFFREMVFPEEYNEILNHKTALIWGPYVVAKFFGFELANEYDRVLFMDADLLIRDDISELFGIEEEMAWCNILAWNPTENFKDLLVHPKDYISAGNAGLYYFSGKLRKYNITRSDIVAAFEKVKSLKRGGSDELVIAWIVYEKGILLKELERDIYNIPARRARQDSKILHFLDHLKVSTKPWRNLAAYLYFADWAENYQRWIQMGGEGLVQFTQKDYYQLFAFDKDKKIGELEAKVKELKQRVDLDSYNALEAKYQAVINSKSWKITAPLRWLGNIIKRLKKKVKTCFKK